MTKLLTKLGNWIWPILYVYVTAASLALAWLVGKVIAKAVG